MEFSMVLKTIKKYLYLIRIAFIEKLAYPKAVCFDVIGIMISILIYYYLWCYVFSKTESVSSYSTDEMVMYVILARILSNQFAGGIDMQFSKWVYEGKIGIELLRPISLLKILVSRRIGEFLFFCVLKGMPVFIVTILVLDGVGAFKIYECILFGISIIFSLLIMFYIEVLVGLCSFYTMNSYGLRFTKNALLSILSGGIIPIFILPEIIKKILYCLPFIGIVTIPIEILLGKYNLFQIGYYLVFQIIWVLVMGKIVHILLERAIEKVTIQGG